MDTAAMIVLLAMGVVVIAGLLAVSLLWMLDRAIDRILKPTREAFDQAIASCEQSVNGLARYARFLEGAVTGQRDDRESE